MKSLLRRSVAILIVAAIVPSPAVWATCGGGGGGGTGGVRPGGAGMPNDERVYQVPWKIAKPEDPPVAAGLVLYWFPSSVQEVRVSSMLFSRTLSLYASQCVTMAIADAGTAIGQKLAAGDSLPVAVLAEPNGTLIGKAENKKGMLKVEQAEKLLESEMKRRESALKEQMESAKARAKAGDKDAAIPEFRTLLEHKCLFPKIAKDAAKELKKLGVTDVAEIPDSPIFEKSLSTAIDRKMRAGLRAENMEQYEKAQRLYTEAHQMDPADPTPLRYLGELQRHHTGDWDAARVTFNRILAMPADRLSRAVALHGLGKMTIHDGEFVKGRVLMEQSVEVLPIALTYRNLAVYWNSEGDVANTDKYLKLALEMDPTDPYNLVFVAAFMADRGKGEEALKIARENEKLLSASYNLAAIYAQMGHHEKALTLLKRHFFEYERYQSVRAKEMMEARVDAVFVSLRNDPAFLELTAGADGKLPIPPVPAGNGMNHRP